MAFVAVGILSSGTSAPLTTNKSSRSVSRASLSCQPTTRRAFLFGALATTLVSTQSAIADIEKFTEESATKVIKDIRVELSDLTNAANLGEYEALRLELRKGSLGQLRLAGTALSTAQGEETRNAYRKVIGRVEQLDSHALRAERGGNTEVVATDINAAVDAIDNLLQVAAK